MKLSFVEKFRKLHFSRTNGWMKSGFMRVGLIGFLTLGILTPGRLLVRAAVVPDTVDLPCPALSAALAETDRVWKIAMAEVNGSLLPKTNSMRPQLAKRVDDFTLVRGVAAKKEVAITFDDGPHPYYTPRLLQILKDYHAKATFFVIGQMAEKHPELIRQEVDEGHSVGNHTFHHINLLKASDKNVEAEIQGCGDVIEEITHRKCHLFRPPGGDYNNRVAEDAAALGYTMVLWNNNPGDYKRPTADVIENRLLKRIHNGSIILVHDGVEQTVTILPSLLTYLHAHGYEAVTIDEMIKDRRSIAPMRVAVARKINSPNIRTVAFHPSTP